MFGNGPRGLKCILSEMYLKYNFVFFAVSCSTVTVTKCQAALRTLQGFPYFSPTCLCQEPHRDPECNQIREFLFDHPCGIVKTKGNFYWLLLLMNVSKKFEMYPKRSVMYPKRSVMYPKSLKCIQKGLKCTQNISTCIQMVYKCIRKRLKCILKNLKCIK